MFGRNKKSATKATGGHYEPSCDCPETLSAISSHADIITWCKNFMAVTEGDAATPRVERGEYLYLAALIALIFDWCQPSDLSLSGLMTALTLMEPRPYDEEHYDPLDMFFRQISHGDKLVPDSVKGNEGDSPNLTWSWVPNSLRRSDGVRPGNCGGLAPCKDFALFCYQSVKYLPSVERTHIRADLSFRILDYAYRVAGIDLFEPQQTTETASIKGGI